MPSASGSAPGPAPAPASGAGTASGTARRGLVVAAGAIVVLVGGVAAGVDPGGLRPFTTARWAVVGVAAAVAAASVRWRPPRAVAVLGVALLGWVALATVTALDPVTALVGHPRRHFGLAGWVVCALALLAGTGVGDGPAGRDVRRLIGRAVAAAGVVTGVTVAADLAGWDPLGVRFADGRVGGLLGQPLYLAAAALLMAPVAAGVALDPGEWRGWRVAGGVGAAGAVVALAASQTRGAWSGAVVAGAVVALCRGRHRGTIRATAVADGAGAPSRSDGPAGSRRGRRARRPALAGVALVLAGAGLVAAGPRVADLTDPDAPGGAGRLDEWRVAAGVVVERPVTGTGPEGYRIAAPAHIGDGYTLRHGRDEVVDRAHSAPLDVAASAGLPAAALYVALLGLVVVRAARVVGRSSDPVLVGAAVAVVAWSVQLVVGFPIAEVDPLAWLLAGAVVAAPAGSAGTVGRSGHTGDVGRSGHAGDVGRSGQQEGVGRSGGVGGVDRAAGRRGRRARVVVAGTVAVVLGGAGLVAVTADRALARADEARGRGDIAAALASADRATRLRPDDVDAWYLATRIAATPDGLPALDNALDRVEAGLDRLPGDPALRHLHTALLVERAQRSGLADDLAAAESSARRLVADDPASPAALRALGLVLVADGRTAEARTALGRAAALDPDDAATLAARRRLEETR